MLYEIAADVFEYLARPFELGPTSRLFLLNWLVFLVCGAGVFALAARRGAKPARSAFSFMFPRETYFHRSTLTDVKVYIANFFVRFSLPGLKTFNTSLVATLFCALAAPVFGDAAEREPTLAMLVVLTIIAAMASDLVTYCTHRLSHEWRVLWPFHELHHSAEVLTPLTLFRKHPFYNFVHQLTYPLVAGPILGVLIAAFGQLSFVQILGINMVYAIFNFSGANLRHSHIWISFGPVFSRIFVSPAMHQVHHSIDPRHYNKNYGEVFALWDWAFGSIYVPRTREELTFGITDAAGAKRVQPHGTLREAYVRPFLDSYDAMKGRPPRPAPAVDTPPEVGGTGAEDLSKPHVDRPGPVATEARAA